MSPRPTDAELEEHFRRLGERAATEAASLPPAAVQATAYLVSCLPEGDEQRHFSVTVEYRGDGRWGVFRHAHCCLGADGEWSYGYSWGDRHGPATDAEWDAYNAGRDAWIDAHRFDLDTALDLARAAAPLLTVNGHTVSDALRRERP